MADPPEGSVIRENGPETMEASEPPRAPKFRRRIALTRKQRFGLPIIVLVPILALLGIFGERQVDTTARSATVAMAVRYPERFRYRQTQSLEIRVTNLAPKDIDTVHVWLDSAYVTRFVNVRIEPAPRTAFAVDLVRVRPNESRLITVELVADRYGRQRGRVGASTRTDSIAVSLSTLVFP